MLDFEVQRCTRRCARTDIELKPGDVFYSVLLAEGSQVVRRDYSVTAWEGPPAQALGWWKSHLPDVPQRRAHWAPHEVMLEYFQQLDGVSAEVDTRYVLALLLIRRRLARLEETVVAADGRQELVLYCPLNEQEYRVPVQDPDPGRVLEIQQALAQLLFSGSPAS